MSTTDIVSGFRKALQDLLVPEIKSLQTEVKHTNEKIERVDNDLKDLRKDFSAMQITQHDIQLTLQKILDKLDLDKRMTRIETLVEQLIKKAA